MAQSCETGEPQQTETELGRWDYRITCEVRFPGITVLRVQGEEGLRFRVGGIPHREFALVHENCTLEERPVHQQLVREGRRNLVWGGWLRVQDSGRSVQGVGCGV